LVSELTLDQNLDSGLTLDQNLVFELRTWFLNLL
jgi:hypothetical protein